MPFITVRRYEKLYWKRNFVSDILNKELKKLELRKASWTQSYTLEAFFTEMRITHCRRLTCKARGLFDEKAVDDRLGN